MTYDLGTLSGARLWKYNPDWSSGFEVSRSFLTDIVTSRNGTEQRRALRYTPRYASRFSTLVADDRQAANHFLRAWQSKPTAMPDFARYTATNASASGGASTISIASPPAWVADERLLVLCGDGVMELVEVTNVSGSTISLQDTLSNAWPTGSIVRPAMFGLLEGQLASRRHTRGAATIDIAFNAYPGGEHPEAEGTASDTFNGYEVFTADPDFAQAPFLNYLWPVEQIDYGFGRTAQFRPIDQAQQLVEASFTGLSASEAQAIEQVFLRAKGRRGAFYRPSGEKDMTLASDASGTTFLAEGSDLSDDFGSTDFTDYPAAIEICQTNGTRLRRSVTDISASGDNSQITVNSSVTLTVATTARISWMPLVRFASDEMRTLWRTPETAEISTTFQTVTA